MKTIIKHILLNLFLITLFSCSVEDGKDGKDGINGSDGQSSSGLTYVYINGNITDAEAIVKIQNEVGSNTQFIFVENTTALTTLNLSNVTELVHLQISNNPLLTTLDLSNLAKINSYFYFKNNPLVTNLKLSKLKISRGDLRIIGSADLNTNSLQQLDLSELAEVDTIIISEINSGTLVLNNLVKVNNIIDISANPYIVSLNLSNITNCKKATISQNSTLTSIDFSGLSTLSDDLYVIGNSSLTNLNLSALVSVPNVDIRSNDQLVVLDLPLFTTSLNALRINYNTVLSTINMPLINQIYYMQFDNNNLDSNAINGFLNLFVNITPAITNKYIDLSSQLIPAPPTGTGITNYNTLIASGNNIITD